MYKQIISAHSTALTVYTQFFVATLNNNLKSDQGFILSQGQFVISTVKFFKLMTSFFLKNLHISIKFSY